MKYPQLVSMPSAVTDWLDEQLEARGIDALVYTRYILSLLHTDAVDVIYSEEDLHIPHLKPEVRRSSGVSRKRILRSCEWRHSDFNADALKRSAVVKCLMSASEQADGIESLIDELFDKLKEIKSDIDDAPIIENNLLQREIEEVSPQELAKKYYAAFPPLNRNLPTKLSPFIPKWIPSPSSVTIAPSTHFLTTINNGKCLLNNDKFSNRSIIKNYEDKFPNNNNNKQKLNGQANFHNNKRHQFTNNMIDETKHNMADKNCSQSSNGDNNNQNQIVKDNKFSINNNEDDCLPIEMANSVLDDDDEFYFTSGGRENSSLIEELIDKKTEIMNIANIHDSSKKDVIQNDTNVRYSVWQSNERKKINCIDINNHNLFNDIRGRELNKMLINNHDNKINNNLSCFSKQSSQEKKSNKTNCLIEKNQEVESQLKASFRKLNHNSNNSAFYECLTKMQTTSTLTLKTDRKLKIMKDSGNKIDYCNEDLLISGYTHFYPINEKIENSQNQNTEYADGSTFIISSNLDKVNYKRSLSGSLYLENEHGVNKKYFEYNDDNNGELDEFSLKFNVLENNKASQTDSDVDEELAKINWTNNNNIENSDYTSNNNTAAMNTDYSIMDSAIKSTRVYGSYKNDETHWYENITVGYVHNIYNENKCWYLNNVWYHKNSTSGNIWDNKPLNNVCPCFICLNNSSGKCMNLSLLSDYNKKLLRDDIKRDADELFNDLNGFQQSLIEHDTNNDDSTITTNLIISQNQDKRRHSFATLSSTTIIENENLEDLGNSEALSFSFASRLEEDCLLQMSTIPTLRSVTL